MPETWDLSKREVETLLGVPPQEIELWLAREKAAGYDVSDNLYVLSTEKPRRVVDETFDDIDFSHDSFDGVIVCPGWWEKAGGLKLQPGEGPIKVILSITCRRKSLLDVKKGGTRAKKKAR